MNVQPGATPWVIDFPLPDLAKPGPHNALFEQGADEILRVWERRQSLPASKRSENALAWFRRAAYRFLRHYIDNGRTAVFQRTVAKDKRPQRLVAEALHNPFKLGLLAMFSDEYTLSRGDRHNLGNQMIFSWAHDVPPDFINAFVSACGGSMQIAKKINALTPQPGYEHRFDVKRLIP